jgi:signal transduction histidine kinase
VVGLRCGELFGPDAESLLRDALEQGRTVRREEVLLRTEAGGVVPVSFTTSLLRNDRRTVIGAIATFVDLTPFKRAEEHARQLDRLAALGRFTSSVAHEIRNPLTGIAAGVQYLARALEPHGPDAENLEFIQREVKRLDQILQDLFDITHPRGLRVTLVPVEDSARRALQCLEALLGERRVTASIEVAPRTPPVPHDADQMEQVFLNLLKNAAEASPPGAHLQVRVTMAAPAETAGGPGAIAIRIEDQGDGIPVEHLKTVFEPFFTTKQGGSGLGLYISHDIVKRHGGSITVHSEPGQGTTFTVELPMEHSGGQS